MSSFLVARGTSQYLAIDNQVWRGLLLVLTAFHQSLSRGMKDARAQKPARKLQLEADCHFVGR